MPLTDDQERVEHQLRVDQMTVNIEKMRLEIKTDTRRFAVQLAAVLIGAIGTTVALMTFIFAQLLPHLH